jgi:hypothetical protein
MNEDEDESIAFQQQADADTHDSADGFHIFSSKHQCGVS